MKDATYGKPCQALLCDLFQNKKRLTNNTKVGYGRAMKTLKSHMKKYGLRVRDVSQMTGIPIRTVNAHLYGERQIGAKSALLYADGLGISLEQIIKDRVA